MKNVSVYKKASACSYILYACLSVGKSLPVIKNRFQYMEITEIENTCQENRIKVMEIRFDTATLNCLFDKDDMCYFMFLLPDEPDDIQYYTDYLYEKYPYDSKLRIWMNNDIIIRLDTKGEICMLEIFRKGILSENI